jgi:hypothetical protein
MPRWPFEPPRLAESPSSKVIGRGMIGKAMKDMTFGFIPLANIPLPFFRS